MNTNTNNRGRFMRISTNLLDMIDFNMPYEMQLAMTLLYKGQAMLTTWDDTLIETTPSLLIKAFGNYKDINKRQQTNVVNALLDMRDRGLVSFNDDIKFKDEVSIDTKPLLDLAQQGNYVELLAEDFYTIMETDSTITINGEQKELPNSLESLLLQAFLIVKARWNFKTIDMLADVEDFNYAINSDKDVQQAKGAFCSDTLDFIRTHKHYELDAIDTWCDDRYLSAYLDKLQDLGCLKIKDFKMKAEDGSPKTRNFYYVPTMSYECIDAMIRQYARRNNYAIKEQMAKVEPQQPTEEQPKQFAKPRGGKRKASGASNLASLEHGCTSDGNKKAHEKARARNWDTNTVEHIETNGKEIEFDLTDLYIQPKCSERVNRDKKW